MRVLLLVLVSLALAGGDIYIRENDDGTITFTDTPPPKAALTGFEVFIEEKPMPLPHKVNLATYPMMDSFDWMIIKTANRYGLPQELLKAVALAESGMNPNAVSRVGAQGLMQLMPGTAADLGVKDSFDPEQNLDGGARYLSEQLKTFNGSKKLALAAYNAGPHNVKKHGGIPPFEETQKYVPRVLALYDYFRIERPIVALPE